MVVHPLLVHHAHVLLHLLLLLVEEHLLMLRVGKSVPHLHGVHLLLMELLLLLMQLLLLLLLLLLHAHRRLLLRVVPSVVGGDLPVGHAAVTAEDAVGGAARAGAHVTVPGAARETAMNGNHTKGNEQTRM